MRQADRDEVYAASGASPDGALRRAVALSDRVYSARVGGELAAILGVAPISLLAGEGAPWMLGTDLVSSHPRQVLLIGREMVQDWLHRYQRLSNWVDARNTASIRWLARIGFTIRPAQPYGAFGAMFHRFEVTRRV